MNHHTADGHTHYYAADTEPTTRANIDLTDRQRSAIAALRELATFLEGHPDAPVGEFEFVDLQRCVRGPDAEAVAEVDRIAAVLGVTASWYTNHYRAVRRFGTPAAAEYRAVYIDL